MKMMKHFWILAFVGWMSATELYGEVFRVVLFCEREDMYYFKVEEIGDFSKVIGHICSSNEKKTSVEVSLGNVTGLCSTGSMVTFRINECAFILKSNRHVTIWSKGKNEHQDLSNNEFNVYMGEATPLRKLKEPSFFLDRKSVDGKVNFFQINDPEGKSDDISGFEIISPYGPNGHPWFSADPIEQIKFDETTPRPSEPKVRVKKDFRNDDMGFFMRKK